MNVHGEAMIVRRTLILGWVLMGVACVELRTAPVGSADRPSTDVFAVRDATMVDGNVDEAAKLDGTTLDTADASTSIDGTTLDTADATDTATLDVASDRSALDGMDSSPEDAPTDARDAAMEPDVRDVALADIADAASADCCVTLDVPLRPSVLVGGFVTSGSAGNQLTGGFTWQAVSSAGAIRLEGWVR